VNTIMVTRGIQALLQVLQGDYSSGAVTMTATGADVEVRAPVFGIPIVNGAEDESRLIKVEKNSALKSGYWTVTDAGVDVDVTSMQGGAHVNLAEATQVRWDPPMAGIEPLAVVAAGGLTGGTRSTAFGALRQVRHYKDMGLQKALEFFQAQVADYPAALLSWHSTSPADGAAIPGLGPDATRLGNGRRMFAHNFELGVISSRRDGADIRRKEGDQLRDDLLELLTDRVGYRNCPISTGRGLQIIEARFVGVSPNVYIDLIRFSCQYELQRRDSRTFNDWIKTRLQIEKPDILAP
jgi:hypothetical protein